MTTNVYHDMTTSNVQEGSRINWRQVGLFVGLTFALSWSINLVIWLVGGVAHPAAATWLQMQMLVPALCALALERFVFRTRHDRGAPRWLVRSFFVYAAIVLAVAIASTLLPDLALALSALVTLASFGATAALFVLRWRGGREAFDRAGLRLGRARDWLLYGIAFVLFYASQTGLNALFGLGGRVDLTEAAALNGMPPQALLIVGFVQSVVFAPVVMALMLGFGEEYGWRGYLQGTLERMGRVRGVLLVGLIWGIWHVPAVLLGHNYPGRPLLGSLLMIAYSVLMGFVFGYVMLKTRAIWLVAFLHAVNNHTYQYLTLMVYAPDDPALSFGGPGLFSLVVLAGIVALLLRDPVWRERVDF